MLLGAPSTSSLPPPTKMCLLPLPLAYSYVCTHCYLSTIYQRGQPRPGNNTDPLRITLQQRKHHRRAPVSCHVLLTGTQPLPSKPLPLRATLSCSHSTPFPSGATVREACPVRTSPKQGHLRNPRSLAAPPSPSIAGLTQTAPALSF